MLTGEIAFAASPAVILEYEDVLKRDGIMGSFPITHGQIDVILDALCSRAIEAHPFFRFRPFLVDPKDDLFVECALVANARLIVTDDKHFKHPAVKAFGLRPVKAQEFVQELRFERRPK